MSSVENNPWFVALDRVLSAAILSVAILSALGATPAHAQAVVLPLTFPVPPQALWAVYFDDTHALVLWSTLSDPTYAYSEHRLNARMLHLPSAQWVGETARISDDAANVKVVSLGWRSVVVALNSYADGTRWWHLHSDGEQGALVGSPGVEQDVVGLVSLGADALSFVGDEDNEGLVAWRLTDTRRWQKQAHIPLSDSVPSMDDVQLSVCGGDLWMSAPSGSTVDVRKGLYLPSPWREIWVETYATTTDNPVLACIEDVPYLFALAYMDEESADADTRSLGRVRLDPLPDPDAPTDWEWITLPDTIPLNTALLLPDRAGQGLFIQTSTEMSDLNHVYALHLTATTATPTKLATSLTDLDLTLGEDPISTACTSSLQGAMCTSRFARLKLWREGDQPPLPLDPVTALQNLVSVPALILENPPLSASPPDPRVAEALAVFPPPSEPLDPDAEPVEEPPSWVCGPAAPVDEDWLSNAYISCDSDPWQALSEALHAYCASTQDPQTQSHCPWLQRHFSCSHLFAERELAELMQEQSAWSYLRAAPTACRVTQTTIEAHAPFSYYAAKLPVEWDPDAEAPPKGEPLWAKLHFAPASPEGTWTLESIAFLQPIFPPFGPHTALVEELRRHCASPSPSQAAMCATLLAHFKGPNVPPLSAYNLSLSRELSYCYCDATSYTGFNLSWHYNQGLWWLHEAEARDCSESDCNY